MGFSVYHVDVRKKKKTDIKKKGYIPFFFDFDITYLEKDNYRVVSTDDGIKLYITPLIRTLLNDLKHFQTRDESLSRTIKEKIDCNARLLLKKSVEYAKIVLIDNKQFIMVNANVKVISERFMRIMNDSEYKNKSVI